MGLTHSRVCKLQSSSNPMFGAKRLSRTVSPITVVALTPNIKLAFFFCHSERNEKPLTPGTTAEQGCFDFRTCPASRTRSPLSMTNSGGADRDRTGGLLVANQALSQLSYSPKTSCQRPVPSCQSRWQLTTGNWRLLWWAWVDLNYRPHPYQGCALAT